MTLTLAEKGQPLAISHEKICNAIYDFSEETVKTNKNKFFLRTIASVCSATDPSSSYDFWFVVDENNLLAYCLAEFGPGSDGSNTYYINQAWLHKSIRHKGLVKPWLDEIIASARSRGAEGISLFSSRNPKAYCRFLGKNWHHTTTILELSLKDN